MRSPTSLKCTPNRHFGPVALHNRALRIMRIMRSTTLRAQATGAAGTVALKLMTDPNVPAAVRLRAAEFVFDRAIRGVELEDIEERLAELERAAEASKSQKK